MKRISYTPLQWMTLHFARCNFSCKCWQLWATVPVFAFLILIREYLCLGRFQNRKTRIFLHAKSWIFFKTRNAKSFLKTHRIKKNHKNGAIFKSNDLFIPFIIVNYNNTCFFLFFWSCEYFSCFKFAKVFSAKFVPKAVKR